MQSLTSTRDSTAGPAGTATSTPPRIEAPYFGEDWWQRGVVYQIYPRSFADSDGNGVGDLGGIIERLDHLNDGTPGSLGVDAIWLSPIYPSPGLDLGYDVSDHATIDPLFGSLADFDRLVDEAHRRGVRVILDLVMNHTSDAHAWFAESRLDRTNPRADWYLWRDAAGADRRGRPKRPNNWQSFFGGPAWTWDPGREQFYLHTFLPEQPDLNWREPAVRMAMLGMVRGWLDRGVDGFRLDVFNIFFKHEQLPSNPRRPLALRPYRRQQHRHDRNQPELRELLAEFRVLVDEAPGRMTVGELFDGTPAIAAGYTVPRHLAFDFRMLAQPWRARSLGRVVAERERVFTGDRWPCIVLSNHDQSRHVSRLGGRDPDSVARAAAMLLLTLRGTPFLYYGEEIAMPDIEVPRAEIIDPPARRSGILARLLAPWWNRDRARAPMAWSDGPNGGFSTGRPWLRPIPDAATRNVEQQRDDPASVLSFYRRLIWLRRELPALQIGAYRRLRTPSDVLGYLRLGDGQAVLVAVNTGQRAQSIRLSGHPSRGRWTRLLGTHDGGRPNPLEHPDGSDIALQPNEGLLLRAD